MEDRNNRIKVAPQDPAPVLPDEEDDYGEGEDEVDPLDEFMAENNEEAFKDLEQSVAITKMDRMKEITNIGSR